MIPEDDGRTAGRIAAEEAEEERRDNGQFGVGA